MSDSDGPQKSVEPYPRAAEADCVFDSYRASEGLFVCFDLCPLNKLCGSRQVMQGLNTIRPSGRPSDQRQTARQVYHGGVGEGCSESCRPGGCAKAVYKSS